MFNFKTRQSKSFGLFLLDFSCLLFAWALAYLFRFSLEIYDEIRYVHALHALGFVVIAYMCLFFVFKIDRIIWRYASFKDMLCLGKSIFFGYVLASLLVYLILGLHYVPSPILPLHAMFYLFTVLTSRSLYLLYRNKVSAVSVNKKVLIIGAGHVAAGLIRNMEMNRAQGLDAVGILDDDINLHGRQLYGVQVLGGTDQLLYCLEHLGIDLVMAAIPSISEVEFSKLYDLCSGYGVSIQAMPGLGHLALGQVTIRGRNVADNIVSQLISEELKRPIDLKGYAQDQLLSFYQTMMLIRQVEDTVANMVVNKEIKCPTHLGAGQEAIAVGVCAVLNKSDYVFGTHRAHAHFLSLGGKLHGFFAEVLGKHTGCAHGLGGSMHLFDQDNGFYGSVPIVGATIPIAAGAALAIKRQKKHAVAVCFFGDGATEEGVFHETLNMAASMKLPVLFVVENNLYSSHLDIQYRQPSERTERFAKAHCIKSEVLDGNNVIVVHQAAMRMVEYIKETGKPGFLEFVTHRIYGHVGPNKDIDVGVRRSESDLKLWSERDPIDRFVQALTDLGIDPDKCSAINANITSRIEEALRLARQDPYPKAQQLLDNVYSVTGAQS